MRPKLGMGAALAGAVLLMLCASPSTVPSAAAAKKSASVQKQLKDMDRGKIRRTARNPRYRSSSTAPPARKHSPLTMPK
jgi:hypothetical protein